MNRRNQPDLSDSQIRAELRSVMTRHRFDVSKTSFVCVRGVVRMSGELQRLRAYATNHVVSTDLELLEQDLARVRGVVRVYIDVKGWQREVCGSWRNKVPRSRRRALPSAWKGRLSG